MRVYKYRNCLRVKTPNGVIVEKNGNEIYLIVPGLINRYTGNPESYIEPQQTYYRKAAEMLRAK